MTGDFTWLVENVMWVETETIILTKRDVLDELRDIIKVGTVDKLYDDYTHEMLRGQYRQGLRP
jgi:hypothetical protein